MTETREKLETEIQAFQDLNKEFQTVVTNRQRLGAQLGENEMVLKEFNKMKPGELVYKQLGPVLLKQDLDESKNNVDKRIQFIQTEIKSAERRIKELEDLQDTKRAQIIKLQQTLQQAIKGQA